MKRIALPLAALVFHAEGLDIALDVEFGLSAVRRAVLTRVADKIALGARLRYPSRVIPGR